MEEASLFIFTVFAVLGGLLKFLPSMAGFRPNIRKVLDLWKERFGQQSCFIWESNQFTQEFQDFGFDVITLA